MHSLSTIVGWMDPRVSCNVSLWLEMQDWKSGQWVKAPEGCSKYVVSSVIFVLNLHFYFHVFEHEVAVNSYAEFVY